jgi:RimJ/RimL family protein N-acetyltransferase
VDLSLGVSQRYETRERFHRWMEEALAATAAGEKGAWAIIDRASGRPIGSTRPPVASR